MDKGKKYGIVAAVVVIIIIVAAGAWFLSQDNGGNDTVKGDTYYVYLDGMGDVDGWYSGVGDNPRDGFCSALDGSVEYGLTDEGWINSIDGLVGGNGSGFGVYAYGSTDFGYVDAAYFNQTGVINDSPSNIIYISYGPYTYNAELGQTTYAVNPMNCEGLTTSGPFTEDNYQPLTNDGTFYVYLDGISDEIDGWYTGTGSNPVEGFSNALEGKVEFEVSASGWINTIGGLVGEGGMNGGTGFATYEYMCTNTSYNDRYYFLQGPTLNALVSNIIYVSFSEYTMDENYVTTYMLNPLTSTEWATAEGSPFTA